MSKLVYGVGINDADYHISPIVDGRQIICLFYQRWRSMLQRCYSPKSWVKRPTYEGCSVIDEWLTFSNFRAWMVEQDWEGNQLDKDLLIEGNKVYGPETCIFICQELNKLLNDHANARGDLPLGVCKNGKNYQALVCSNNKQIYLGTFKTSEEAHNAWRKAKSKVILESRELTDDLRVKKVLIKKAMELIT